MSTVGIPPLGDEQVRKQALVGALRLDEAPTKIPRLNLS